MYKEYEKKLEELQYALRTRGILKTKKEIFNWMIELAKQEFKKNNFVQKF
jgi:hypothetical protein